LVHGFVLTAAKSRRSEGWLDGAGTSAIVRCDGAHRPGNYAYFHGTQSPAPTSSSTRISISYSVNPQVNAFDNASRYETWKLCRTTVRARAHLRHLADFAISPITLEAAFQTRSRPVPEPERAPENYPSRSMRGQMSLFGRCRGRWAPSSGGWHK
jgi:hypothetical protein